MNEVVAQVMLVRERFPMAFRSQRAKTFCGHEDLFSVSTSELWKNGFFYVGSSHFPDAVQCFYCHGRLYDWQLDNNVAEEHSKAFPYCPVFGEFYGNQL